MLKVGLTGGIGSGKTTVAKIFEVLGIPVYKADTEAKRLMQEDPALRESIALHFGNACFTGGQLNRKLLADIVFNDVEKLTLLNSLVHPATIKDGIHWMDQQQAPYAIKESALIFESNNQDVFDFIIGVSAPLSLRMARSSKRDQTSQQKTTERMQHQMEESVKMQRCHTLLVNDNQVLLVPQVLALHKKLLAMAESTAQHTH